LLPWLSMAVRYGRYEVLYKLGQGAMAQVYLAKDPVLSRFVAVKVLHADLAARKDVLHRFFNEARTVAIIRNPHVVEVFDFGQEGKDLYLVMEFVDGLSLHGLMRRGTAPQSSEVKPEAKPDAWPAPGRDGAPIYQPLDPLLAAALMCQAAEGLSIAAQHGVVHRDLKPENLMLNTQGYLKISDFGIAHVQDDSLTKTGAVLGSPLYMSPEQARGLKPITTQSDMFSLGSVFYACLVGHPPFQGRTVTELFRRISSDAHPPLLSMRPDLDPGLGNLVDTLLRKSPSARGGGPRWLQRELKAFLSMAGVADPAELAAGHLREAHAKGMRTTWNPDARNATLPMTVASTQQATARSRPGHVLPPGTTPSTALPMNPSLRPDRTGFPRRSAGSWAWALALLALGMGIMAGGWKLLDKIRESQGHSSAGAGFSSGRNAGRGSGEDDRTSGQTIPSGIEAGPGNLRDTLPPALPGSGSAEPAAIEVSTISSAPSANSRGQGTLGESAGKENEASIILKSSPPFAEAYVDGRFLGTTPIRLAHLAPGRHRLELKSPRLPGLDTSLMLMAGMHALKVRLDAGPGQRMAAIPVEGE
jgi:serine/threonine protein kinase